MKIGIPRAMSYHYYYPFYKAFLEELGAAVVVSSPTNRKTLDRITACPTDEPCISVKLLFPHAQELIDQGVDGIFLPVLCSGRDASYFCPKHIGLPFMLKNAFALTDDFLLSPRIDARHRRDGGMATFIEVAAKISGADKNQATRAYRRGELAQRNFIRHTCRDGITTQEAFHLLDSENPRATPKSCGGPYPPEAPQTCVGVVAHSYMLYDYLGQNLVQRLQEYGPVLTPEMVWPRDAYTAIGSIYDGAKLWSFEIQMMGSALHWLQRGSVSRLIFLYPFECGPAAVMESFLEKEAEKRGIPLLILTVDEHTGEAGLVTRLEAFMDTSPRGSRRPAPSGQKDELAPPGRPLFYPVTLEQKKIVGMPSMGYLNLALASTFNDLGIKIVNPPITERTIELGLELAPEFICYPLVVTLGQMRQALEGGATHILMVEGKGRCRLGWYSQVQEILLRRAGYEFEMISIDSPFPLRQRLGHFLKTIGKISTKRQPLLKTARSLWLGYQKGIILDDTMKELLYLRAVEQERGKGDEAFSKLLNGMHRSQDWKEVQRCLQIFRDDTGKLRRSVGEEPYRIRIVGEIYVIMEDFVNLGLVKTLGSLPGQRVWVDREVCTTTWFRTHILKDRKIMKRHHRIREAASHYLDELVGGHGLESVGLTTLAHKEGMEGVIHLFPFTCLPEIVAQNIMTRVGEDFDLPLLTLIINEQTGEAGMQTRLEAFLDIVEQRRKTHRRTKEDALLPRH